MATTNAAAPSPTPSQPGSRRVRHPQAELIRDKFDWWFSTENLRKDAAVLSFITAKGPNSTVNVGRLNLRLREICEPKPSIWQIMDALKDSKMVDIVDKNHVRRKVLYVYDTDSYDEVWKEEDKCLRLKPAPLHPAVKVGTFKKDHATGFEENFADAPITPREHEEESRFYDLQVYLSGLALVVADWVAGTTKCQGYAIERFVARRKFTKEHQKAFGNFLRYGGVYPASRVTQGESNKDIQANEELSKEEKLEMCARYNVDWIDKIDNAKWAIDFEGVAKAYLSTEFAENLDGDYNGMKVDNQCNVLSNFYNYLLLHDVCPEHNGDILAARRIAEEARIQLNTIQKLVVKFPPPFSKACSVIFGGEWQKFFGHDASWGDYGDEENPQMSKGDAKIIVGAALMSLAGDAIYDAAFPEDGDNSSSTFEGIKYTEKCDVTLEIVGIERATEKTLECYKASGIEEKQLNASCIGKLICKYWRMDTEEEWDIPQNLHTAQVEDEVYTFWLEDDILADCFNGMKMSATIQKLDVAACGSGQGFWVLDSVSRLYCSFFTYLVNEMCVQKSKGLEWHDEVALMGCRHEEAEKARLQLSEMWKQAEEESKDG